MPTDLGCEFFYVAKFWCVMHMFNRWEIASISNWLTLSHGREHPLSLLLQMLALLHVRLKMQGKLFVYLGKSGIFCYPHMEGIFLFWKFGENFSVSWPWNKHECFLNLFPLYMRSTNCLVSCIGNADCLSIGVPDGLFHKLWWISKFCNIANVIYTDCCYCGQLYKMCSHSKLYIYIYIHTHTHLLAVEA